MTYNDRWLTKAMVKIPQKHTKAAELIRRGDILGAIEMLEQETRWLDEARRRAKEIANETHKDGR